MSRALVIAGRRFRTREAGGHRLMAARAGGALRWRRSMVGPDYIDPGYHALATGRPAAPLDPVLVGEQPRPGNGSSRRGRARRWRGGRRDGALRRVSATGGRGVCGQPR